VAATPQSAEADSASRLGGIYGLVIAWILARPLRPSLAKFTAGPSHRNGTQLQAVDLDGKINSGLQN
jgi:hypothetical protein